MAPEFISCGEAASILGIRRETLRMWRGRNFGPAYYKMSKEVKYLEVDVMSFIDSCRKETKC